MRDFDNRIDETISAGRRKFLVRNIVAIGTIAATGLASKPASAMPPPRPPGGPGHGGPGRGGACFLKGTKIQTVSGERNIEDLAIGDMLPTVFGGARAVRWVGRYVYRKTDAARPWNIDVRPIRIARSAIAPDVPRRDLFVSNWHCLYIDGVLTPAGNLVNGKTISACPADESDTLEYFHIKLESHDVIFAEGAPCETLLEVNENASNFAEYFRLYGEPAAEEEACAPMLYYKGRRGLIASRLRSAASPWFDRRMKIDVIRDRLEDRAIALAELPA